MLRVICMGLFMFCCLAMGGVLYSDYATQKAAAGGAPFGPAEYALTVQSRLGETTRGHDVTQHLPEVEGWTRRTMTGADRAALLGDPQQMKQMLDMLVQLDADNPGFQIARDIAPIGAVDHIIVYQKGAAQVAVSIDRIPQGHFKGEKGKLVKQLVASMFASGAVDGKAFATVDGLAFNRAVESLSGAQQFSAILGTDYAVSVWSKASNADTFEVLSAADIAGLNATLAQPVAGIASVSDAAVQTARLEPVAPAAATTAADTQAGTPTAAPATEPSDAEPGMLSGLMNSLFSSGEEAPAEAEMVARSKCTMDGNAKRCTIYYEPAGGSN